MSRSANCNARKTLKSLMPVVGHTHKTFTSEKWARQYCRRGRGQIVDGVLYCFRSGVTDPGNAGYLPRILPPRPHDPAAHSNPIFGMGGRMSGYAGPIVIQAKTGGRNA